MGEEIHTTEFTAVDFKQFHRNLENETALLQKWFEKDIFASDGNITGFELEAWLVDYNFCPAPINDDFLNHLNSPLVVPELSQFNVEINSTPHPPDGHLLAAMRRELTATWAACQQCASKMDAQVVMIGILPTIEEGMLILSNMSPMQRYRALNEQIFRLRQNQPMLLDIQGQDRLLTSHHDVMLESASTSLQIHLQTNPEVAARTYNDSLIASAPMVAVGANAPFLFGKDLWDETRILEHKFDCAQGIACSRSLNDADAFLTFDLRPVDAFGVQRLSRTGGNHLHIVLFEIGRVLLNLL